MSRYVYKVDYPNYPKGSWPGRRHCACVAKMEYERFSPPGEYSAQTKHPLFKNGRIPADICVFDEFLGDKFSRWDEAITKKGKLVRGKTITFKYLGTVDDE